MPELPEVQTIVDDLNNADLIGTAVIGARVSWPATIAGCSPRVFSGRIKGRKITSIRRRGKYIIFDFSGPDTLLIHLRMTGRLHLTEPGFPRLDNLLQVMWYLRVTRMPQWRIVYITREYFEHRQFAIGLDEHGFPIIEDRD